MSKLEKSLLWFWLYNIEGIGSISRRKLLDYYETPERIYDEATEEVMEQLKITKRAGFNLLNSRKEEKIRYVYEQLQTKEIRVITRADECYPERLQHIFDPPGVLYVRGKLPQESKLSIAIVGARECSNYGKEIALHFARELAKQEVQIVSGLARGVDRYAHIGTLEQDGRTFAVMGCGIDICYPKENIDTFMEIIETGGIISEYPPGFQPIAANFPMRNRIISGLSDGILLVEARQKSGSLITMDYGLDQGKNIYACPGRITDTLSYGTNHIIQMGGKLVMSPDDILEDFGVKCGVSECVERDELSEIEHQVYDCLDFMPKHMEEILKDTGLTIEKISEVLFQLQLTGCIKQVGGNYYSKTMN